VTMPRPLPLVDKSHQILLSALEALRATKNPGRQRPRALQQRRASLSAVGGSHHDRRVRPLQPATAENQNLNTTKAEKLIKPGTGKDPKTYTTINEVRYAPDGNHLIIKATAADTSVVEFKCRSSAGPSPLASQRVDQPRGMIRKLRQRVVHSGTEALIDSV
jgi:hypothetical protein